MSNKHLIALAALALLAGCGGGDPSAPNITPEAATTALRAKALEVRAAAVSTAEAARQLMDFAEGSIYASYFPGHPATQSLPPFLYRYYPSTGIYLGVAAGNDANYPDGVYVMGGEFGPNPKRVGAVTDYVTLVDPSGGPTGPNNGCFDLALMDTSGTRLIVDMQFTGEMTGTQHLDSTVGNVTGYEGNSLAREMSLRTTGTGTSQGETVNFDLDLRSYQRRSGDAQVTEYGTVLVTGMVQAGLTGSMTTKLVWNPPVVNKQYALASGQSYSLSRTGKSTATMVFAGQTLSNTDTNLSYTETVKYVGRESTTVPAGTYNTCKFETRTSTSGSVSTSWVIVGKGIPVKSTDTNASGVITQTGQATSITLNGQRL